MLTNMSASNTSQLVLPAIGKKSSELFFFWRLHIRKRCFVKMTDTYSKLNYVKLVKLWFRNGENYIIIARAYFKSKMKTTINDKTGKCEVFRLFETESDEEIKRPGKPPNTMSEGNIVDIVASVEVSSKQSLSRNFQGLSS